jgi:hypothetical protein
MGLEHVAQNRTVTFCVKRYSVRVELRTASWGPGHGASQLYMAPVTCLHELQWQYDASRGREDGGMEAVNVCALQRHWAMMSILGSVLLAMAFVLEGGRE